MAKLFGFVQFDFAGKLPLADGRYLAGRGEGAGVSTGAPEAEWVLVLETIGVPPRSGRRRRGGRAAAAAAEAAPPALTRVTSIQASAPLASPAEAARWLDELTKVEEATAALADQAIAPLNRALHAHAVASADPRGCELSPEQAERVLIGHGSGEETAHGRFADARQVVLGPAGSSRRRREEELQPQERVAAVLRGRERLSACETLLLRARADRDAGRDREAALQLRVGLEALLVELDGALADPGHEADMATLRERKSEAGDAANAALQGDLNEQQLNNITELLQLSERVLRRRRVLQG